MQITGETLEAAASTQLKSERTLPARYQPGDVSGAIRSAARAAKRDSKDYYVVLGNSYGRGCWHIVSSRSDATSVIINSGKRAFRVTKELDVFRLAIN